MTVLADVEGLQPDLESIMTDVLSSILGEEVLPTFDPAPNGDRAISRLAIHDLDLDSYLEIEVLVPIALARLLAARMLAVASPSSEDVVDAVAELGNIAGGNVKAVLFGRSRLSLPKPRFERSEGESSRHPEALVVRAAVGGYVAELAVFPVAASIDLEWPPLDEDEDEDGDEIPQQRSGGPE